MIFEGVLSCYLLNLVWCSNILKIVPQTSDNQNSNITRLENVTLEYAEKHGEISTVPLDQTIRGTIELEKEYEWVSSLTSTFIVVSISVSFVTLGTGLKHVLDGIVMSAVSKKQGSKDTEKGSGSGTFKHFNLKIMFFLISILFTLYIE